MNPSRQEGWFIRNWKWFVPVGCLSMILMIVGFIAAVAYLAFGSSLNGSGSAAHPYLPASGHS